MPLLPPLEVWAGVECTVNRVGDRTFDQLHGTGHHDRLDDLERIRALGVCTVRYPVLWERIECSPGVYDWAWSDARLTTLRALGIDPIVTLVHHGSGPRWTRLDAPSFAPGLVTFARAVAERYPWLRRYTIVNEPLTTARFAGLYGLWYPHARDDRTFVRALLNQCHGISQAMAAIRAVSPAATFVHTEDISVTSARPALQDRADFYNARQWLSLDLLCGRVGDSHDLRGYLQRHGATGDELARLSATASLPATIGLNYYVTSDRYLDDRLERHPRAPVDRSGPVPFVDVEAARVLECGIAGHRRHLMAAWQRFARPLALTEVHLAGNREQQLRWLHAAWHAATAARSGGVPVCAVTSWALFGSCGWDRLVTQPDGTYESGAFDTRGGGCRSTAVARAVTDLSRAGRLRHPVVRGAGWWQPRRFPGGCRLPILIAGAHGTLGRAFVAACRARGLRSVATSRAELDIANRRQVMALVAHHRPWAVINAAAFVDVNAAEAAPDDCHRDNVAGAVALAEAAAAYHAHYVTFSCAAVFDGHRQRAYLEADATAPVNEYGRSKAAAESAVANVLPSALIVRTGPFLAAADQRGLATRSLTALAQGNSVILPDALVAPTFVPELVDTCLDLAIDQEAGLWHLVNEGVVGWSELILRTAKLIGLPCGALTEWPHQPLPASTAPVFSVLASRRGTLMRPAAIALHDYARDLRAAMPHWPRARANDIRDRSPTTPRLSGSPLCASPRGARASVVIAAP